VVFSPTYNAPTTQPTTSRLNELIKTDKRTNSTIKDFHQSKRIKNNNRDLPSANTEQVLTKRQELIHTR
jgi:hypothetical protein